VNFDGGAPGTLWYLKCPICHQLALPPGERLDAQGVLDLFLSMVAADAGYYDKTKMRVFLS
jgi:hypothetical protein